MGRDDGDHLHDHENAYDQAAHIDDVVHHNQSLYNRIKKPGYTNICRLVILIDPAKRLVSP
ncbi:hypothetical protein [Proteus mirabilis]